MQTRFHAGLVVKALQENEVSGRPPGVRRDPARWVCIMNGTAVMLAEGGGSVYPHQRRLSVGNYVLQWGLAVDLQQPLDEALSAGGRRGVSSWGAGRRGGVFGGCRLRVDAGV